VIFRIYHTSSGRPGIRTPPGSWRIYAKEPGLNSHGQYYSAYFTHATGHRSACAIHGYFVVPVIARSHCCFRVPEADARFIYNWVHLGQRFDVYRARS
jgi:lipoprotein-anchoring transpeptidase ErfK/SrfK